MTCNISLPNALILPLKSTMFVKDMISNSITCCVLFALEFLETKPDIEGLCITGGTVLSITVNRSEDIRFS
jgi:hypothetical protein